MTEEKVRELFPEPDDYGCDGVIWLYEPFELYFSEQQLSMIFTDRIATLSQANVIEVDPWIVGPELGLELFTKTLHEERLNHSVLYNHLGQAIVEVNNSGVNVIFDEDNFKLQAIHKRLPV